MQIRLAAIVALRHPGGCNCCLSPPQRPAPAMSLLRVLVSLSHSFASPRGTGLGALGNPGALRALRMDREAALGTGAASRHAGCILWRPGSAWSMREAATQRSGIGPDPCCNLIEADEAVGGGTAALQHAPQSRCASSCIRAARGHRARGLRVLCRLGAQPLVLGTAIGAGYFTPSIARSRTSSRTTFRRPLRHRIAHAGPLMDLDWHTQVSGLPHDSPGRITTITRHRFPGCPWVRFSGDGDVGARCSRWRGKSATCPDREDRCTPATLRLSSRVPHDTTRARTR